MLEKERDTIGKGTRRLVRIQRVFVIISFMDIMHWHLAFTVFMGYVAPSNNQKQPRL